MNDLERLRLLVEVNNAVVSHLDLHRLFTAVATCLRRVVEYDIAGLTLYDSNTKDLILYALEGGGIAGLPLTEGIRVPINEENPATIIFKAGEAKVFRNADLKHLTSPRVKQMTNSGINIGCGVPLKIHDRILGTINMASRTPDIYDEGTLEILSLIAGPIAIAVENALNYAELVSLKDKLNDEKLYLEEEIRGNFENIIGKSASFKTTLKQIESVAPTDSTVLILGETGTGKELIARALHTGSHRAKRTMVRLNCASIPTGLLESELFGHEKGSFTGAIQQRTGRFELADKGTLFLDEIGDISLELQPKLLRVLQEREFERLGSAHTRHVDIRLIAATHRNLESMVSDNLFREDLYYRLNIFPITVPPLRERREDIPLLARFFTAKFARNMGKQIDRIPVDTMKCLVEYDWPGNVRELQNLIERAVIVTKGSDLQVARTGLKSFLSIETNHKLEDLDREHIIRVLKESNWVIGGANGAASRLGLKRTTLQSKMAKLGISRYTN